MSRRALGISIFRLRIRNSFDLFPFHDLAGVYNRQVQIKAELLLSVDEYVVLPSTVPHLVAPEYTFPYCPRSEQSDPSDTLQDRTPALQSELEIFQGI